VLLLQPAFACWDGHFRTCRQPIDRDLETRELAVDPSVTPGRILTREPKHELADRGTGTRPADRRAPVRPTARQKLAVPAADRLRPNEQAPPAIARKNPAQSAEHDSVGERATRPGDLPTEHHQLVAQHQDLHRLPVVRSATQNEQLHEPPQRPVEMTEAIIYRSCQPRPAHGRTEFSAPARVRTELAADRRARGAGESK
jgi:hypothetical protein